jgi:predicted nuclease of predicted toxin-antitoxin system
VNNEELNTALYKKLFAEQDDYRAWLLAQPPEEILNHAYEYAIREDILLSSEDSDFSDKQCKALLKSPSPLRNIFNHWEHQPTGHMEEIRESIESHANKIIRDDFIRSKRVER